MDRVGPPSLRGANFIAGCGPVGRPSGLAMSFFTCDSPRMLLAVASGGYDRPRVRSSHPRHGRESPLGNEAGVWIPVARCGDGLPTYCDEAGWSVPICLTSDCSARRRDTPNPSNGPPPKQDDGPIVQCIEQAPGVQIWTPMSRSRRGWHSRLPAWGLVLFPGSIPFGGAMVSGYPSRPRQLRSVAS
jgi:hypothetical protein